MPCNSTTGKYVVGQRINRWTLLESPINTRHRILCRCDCGNETRTKAEHVFSGASTQCRTCASRAANTKHGGTLRGKRTRLNSIWNGMISRCYSPNHSAAEYYSEQGVRVCDEWRNDFAAFRDWAITNGYQPHLTLDRWPDKNGNYEPSNCRWATWGQQARNKRDANPLTAFGETKLLVEWAGDQRCVVGYNTIVCRRRRGWSLEEALVTPLTVTNRWLAVELPLDE